MAGICAGGAGTVRIRVELPGPGFAVRSSWFEDGAAALAAGEEERATMKRFSRAPKGGEPWTSASPDGVVEVSHKWFALSPLIGWLRGEPPFTLDGLLLEVRPEGVGGRTRLLLVRRSRLVESHGGGTVIAEGGSVVEQPGEEKGRWTIRVPGAP